MNKNSSNQKKHYIGHRERLKERFMLEPSAVNDYELLELILFNAIPRKDVKPLAKELIDQYGDFNSLFYLDDNHSKTNKNLSTSIKCSLMVIRESIKRSLREKVLSKNILSNWPDLMDYLMCTMGHKNTEEFRVLYLNQKNILIADELHSSGTNCHVSVYPRELIKRILFHEASSIILVHNHPGDNLKPSKADISLTSKIIDLCNNINVKIHDHIIVCSGKVYSFKSNNII